MDGLYTLDGDEIDLGEFLSANRDDLTEDQLEEARSLLPGESMTFGGGAASTFTLKRWPVCCNCDQAVGSNRDCGECRAEYFG